MTPRDKQLARAQVPPPGKAVLLWVGPILRQPAEHVGTPGETIPKYEMSLQRMEVSAERREEMRRRIEREAFPTRVNWCTKMMSQVGHAAVEWRAEEFIDKYLDFGVDNPT